MTMQRLAHAASRVCFQIGGVFLLVGMHRYIFGIYPKLIWDRDLPWNTVSYEWCFATALGLAAAGAWLGRAKVVAGDRTAVAAAQAAPLDGRGVQRALEPLGVEFRASEARTESLIGPPSA